MFGERGYWEATTNHIAETAGVSVGSLYEYFANKDALIAALFEEHQRTSRGLVRAISAQAAAREAMEPVPVLIRRFVDALAALHEMDPALHQVLFEQAPLDPRLRDAIAEGERDLVRVAVDLMRRHPDIDVEDPEMAAAVVVSVVEALTHKLAIHPTPGMDHEAYCDAVTEMLAGFIGSGARRH